MGSETVMNVKITVKQANRTTEEKTSDPFDENKFLTNCLTVASVTKFFADENFLLYSMCFLSQPTDISGEHSLRTCTQVRRNVRKSDVVYACKKKKKEKRHTCLAFDFHRAGATRVLTVCSCQRNRLTSSPLFCKRYAFFKVTKAHDRFE